MKEFACGDVVPGCGQIFRAEDESGLMAQVSAHARDDHGMAEIPDDVVAQVKANIHQVS